MHTKYNKLVRDHIPAILAQTGYTYETTTMDEQEYQQALREKLVEEALEAATASETRQLITELADLYEVIDTLIGERNASACSARPLRQTAMRPDIYPPRRLSCKRL